MANVYSTNFIRDPAFNGMGAVVPLYTVPAGYVAVIRDVSIIFGVNIGPGGADIRCGPLETQVIYWHEDVSTTGGTMLYDVRKVVFETETIYAATYGGYTVGLDVNGYLLSLP